MSRCEYCGRENEQSAVTCHECGTRLVIALSRPPVITDQLVPLYPVPPIIEPPLLNAGRAGLILVLTFLAQVIGAAIVSMVFVLVSAVQGHNVQAPDQIKEVTQQAQPLALVSASCLGVIVMVGSAVSLIRRELRVRSPVGAAWVPGSLREIAGAFGLGAVLAITFSAVMAPYSHDTNQKLGPLTTMATTPGPAQLAWVVLALVLAPAPEELLFRGVVYGGFRQSFGALKAGVLMSAIFVFLHITEWSRFPPALLGITGLALLTLWLRVRTNAIGPSIAAHLAYNTIIVVNVLLYTMLHPH